MEGKIALITGAARGLGRAFAEKLLERGAKVCIADINTAVGKNAEKELQTTYSPDRVVFQKCDVTSTNDLEGLFKSTVKNFGQLDIVCNNAGIMHEGDWQQMLNVNLQAVIHGTMLGLEYMSTPKGNGGVIINIASAAGVLPMPFGPVYTASKHGVVGFTRSLGVLSKRNKVRINCLCPSFARTDIINLGDSPGTMLGSVKVAEQFMDLMGIMEPSDVAEAFMKLVSNDVVSGAVMLVTPDQKDILSLPKTVDEIFTACSKL